MFFYILFLFTPILLLILIYFVSLQNRSVTKVKCWFCNNKQQVSYLHKNAWICNSCEQYNGFNEEGDYNQDLYFQRVQPSKHNLKYYALSTSINHSSRFENGLCQRCNAKQEHIMNCLSNFSPKNEKRFDWEYRLYKEQLDRANPLCETCKKICAKKIEADKTLLPMNINQETPWLVPLLLCTINALLSSFLLAADFIQYKSIDADNCRQSINPLLSDLICTHYLKNLSRFANNFEFYTSNFCRYLTQMGCIVSLLQLYVAGSYNNGVRHTLFMPIIWFATMIYRNKSSNSDPNICIVNSLLLLTSIYQMGHLLFFANNCNSTHLTSTANSISPESYSSRLTDKRHAKEHHKVKRSSTQRTENLTRKFNGFAISNLTGRNLGDDGMNNNVFLRKPKLKVSPTTLSTSPLTNKSNTRAQLKSINLSKSIQRNSPNYNFPDSTSNTRSNPFNAHEFNTSPSNAVHSNNLKYYNTSYINRNFDGSKDSENTFCGFDKHENSFKPIPTSSIYNPYFSVSNYLNNSDVQSQDSLNDRQMALYDNYNMQSAPYNNTLALYGPAYVGRINQASLMHFTASMQQKQHQMNQIYHIFVFFILGVCLGVNTLCAWLFFQKY